MNFSVILIGFVSMLSLSSFAQAQTAAQCGDDYGPEQIISTPITDSTTNSNDINNPSVSESDTAVMSNNYNTACDDHNLNMGFNFTNLGQPDSTNNPNSIVPSHTDPQASVPARYFQFTYRDRARQNISLRISDRSNGIDSQQMFSDFLFFPRKILPAIQWPALGSTDHTFKVFLSTDEEVDFDIASKTIVGGVLKEGPIDMNPDRFSRKFAPMTYTGTGTYLRVDRRGLEDRTGTIATVFQGTHSCKISSAKLFNQAPDGAYTFLFATDVAFNEFLKKTCHFSF